MIALMTTADQIALGGVVVSLIAAAVAMWQAADARRARKDAQKASIEAADRAEEANAIWGSIAESQKLVAQAYRPKAWGVPKRVQDRWMIRNTSKRRIRLERIDVKPQSASLLLKMEGSLPLIFASGELLEFSAHERSGLAVRALDLVWRFDDEPDGDLHTSTRTLA